VESLLTLTIAVGGIATGIGAIWAAMVARHQAQFTERRLAQTERSLAEQSQTLREGMAEERQRREAAERERDDLRRELYARREPRESPEVAEEQQGRGQPHSATGGAQEGARRPWWKRVFRGWEEHAERSDCTGRDEVTRGVQHQPCGS
jgi:hypothetical protein